MSGSVLQVGSQCGQLWERLAVLSGVLGETPDKVADRNRCWPKPFPLCGKAVNAGCDRKNYFGGQGSPHPFAILRLVTGVRRRKERGGCSKQHSAAGLRRTANVNVSVPGTSIGVTQLVVSRDLRLREPETRCWPSNSERSSLFSCTVMAAERYPCVFSEEARSALPRFWESTEGGVFLLKKLLSFYCDLEGIAFVF